MALRVLYLLANGLVDAPQILGLTFTRKAASELGERIRKHIGRLSHVGLAGDYDPFDPPVVSTYNAFANGIYRDHAPLIGRESGGVVLGEASAWQLARRVVLESSDGALADLDLGVDRITELVLDTANGLGEHAADPEAVRAMALRVRRSPSTRCRQARRRTRRSSTPAGGRRRPCRCCCRSWRRSGSASGPPEPCSTPTRSPSPSRSSPRPTSSSPTSATGTGSCCSTSTRTPRSCRPACSPACSPAAR